MVLELTDTQVGRLTEHSLLAVGAMALLVGVYLPQGVVGLMSAIWNRYRSGSRRARSSEAN